MPIAIEVNTITLKFLGSLYADIGENEKALADYNSAI